MARALDLHSRGQGFDSLILHEDRSLPRPLPRRGEREKGEKKMGSLPHPLPRRGEKKKGEKKTFFIVII